MMYIHLHLCGCMSGVCRCPWKPEEGIGFLGAGVSGGCELPDADAGNRAGVPWKKRKHSQPLVYLFTPLRCFKPSLDYVEYTKPCECCVKGQCLEINDKETDLCMLNRDTVVEMVPINLQLVGSSRAEPTHAEDPLYIS